MKQKKYFPYLDLRKMSIIIYFIHFVPVTVFHVLADKHLIPYEYGTIEFLVVFALASVCASIIVWASNKYKITSVRDNELYLKAL